MSQAEFIEWQAFYQSEPFGGLRSDINTALIAAILANANRDRKKRKRPFKPSEFMPDWWQAKDGGLGHVAGLLAKMQMFSAESTHDQEQEIAPGTGNTFR